MEAGLIAVSISDSLKGRLFRVSAAWNAITSFHHSEGPTGL